MRSKLILGMLLVGLVRCAGYLWALHGEQDFGYGCLDVDCYAPREASFAKQSGCSGAPRPRSVPQFNEMKSHPTTPLAKIRVYAKMSAPEIWTASLAA